MLMVWYLDMWEYIIQTRIEMILNWERSYRKGQKAGIEGGEGGSGSDIESRFMLQFHSISNLDWILLQIYPPWRVWFLSLSCSWSTMFSFPFFCFLLSPSWGGRPLICTLLWANKYIIYLLADSPFYIGVLYFRISYLLLTLSVRRAFVVCRIPGAIFAESSKTWKNEKGHWEVDMILNLVSISVYEILIVLGTC